ncbi:MAG TPA: GDP-mannose 4,6-dehydratase [Bacteroidia bacterium]|nr:GDP-mannose 4,6-dehydratase [Bacteroidia bacterium]
MKKKTVLISGVAGMIGSHLLDDLLVRGYDVRGMDNFSYGSQDNISAHITHPSFRFEEADILDLGKLEKMAQGVETIIHLAAVKKIGEKDASYPTLSVNATGTENVFNVARKLGCKVIFASTSDVYGMSPDLPLREDGDLLIGPSMIKRWSYAVSKLYGEQLANAYYRDFGVPVVILRYFGAFSPRSNFSWSGGHIPIFIRQILNNEDVTIHGDGSQTRSMGFVSDLVEGTRLALESDKALGEIINIGNHEEMSVLDSARLIHTLSESAHELKIKFIPMQEVFGAYKDIMRRVPDLSKAERLLGYKPRVSMREAILQTLREARQSKA